MPAYYTRRKDDRKFLSYTIRLPAEMDGQLSKLCAGGKTKSRMLAEICERALRKPKLLVILMNSR